MDATERYDSLIRYYWERAVERFALDVTLVDWRLFKALIRAESSFNPEARSARGALGLTQLMEAVDLEEDGKRDADNPEQAINEGVAKLGKMWRLFAAERGIERWRFALAAYNAGQGNVIQAQTLAAAKGRPTDCWSIVALELPAVTGEANARETTDYVRKIVAEMLAARVGGPPA